MKVKLYSWILILFLFHSLSTGCLLAIPNTEVNNSSVGLATTSPLVCDGKAVQKTENADKTAIRVSYEVFPPNSDNNNIILSVSLYGFSCLIFIFTLRIVKRLQFPYQKIWLILCVIMLFSSAVYHTFVYGKPVWKSAVDQEGFYYPKVNNTYSEIENHTFENLKNQIVYCRRSNALYPFVYWNMKRAFGSNYFLEGFFFTCILNSILFLFAVDFLFKIFNFFKPSRSASWFYCFVFFQPFMVMRSAIPCANSLTVFSLILFLYTMVFSKRLRLKLLSCFLCFLAHKTFYLPALVTSCYLLWSSCSKVPYRTKAILLIVFSLSGMWILKCNKNVFLTDVLVAEKNHYGNSYIPENSLYKKVPNFYLAPLITNTSSFFYKSEQGNIWGWRYAIYINLLVLLMLLKICFSIKNFRNLNLAMKRLCFISCLFIVLFFIEGVRLTNYLNANRHATNTLVVWIVLMLALQNKNRAVKESL